MATSDRLESNDPIKQQNLNQLHFVDNVSQTSLSQIVHKNYIQNQLDFGTLSIKIMHYSTNLKKMNQLFKQEIRTMKQNK